MKAQTYKPLLWIGTIIVIVSLACNVGKTAVPSPTEAPPPKPPTKEPLSPTEEKPATKPPEPTKSGAVSNLDDVSKAVIQIEADGTFVDPEVGWQVNVGKLGSGFIIDPKGIAITNNHVVTGAALLKIWIGGDKNKVYNAKVLGVSECSDLAVIDIQGDGFPYLEWFDSKVTTGLKVFAAGYPLGDPSFTLTDGIVSKPQASGETSWASVDSVIQHTAKILPGNSGGPLVNENGQVVGINYANVNELDMNFAVGRDEALKVIDELKSGKNVDSIGVNGGAVVGTTANGYNISGVWVRSVESGSPSDKTRIQPGDVIYQLEGQVLSTDGTMADYCDILRSHNASDTLAITVIRWGEQSYWEGQVNGRELEYKADLSGSNTGGDTGGNTGGTTGDYVTVQDNTNTIQMDVPSSWTDIDGSVWNSTWGDLTFDAPTIRAATDLTLFYDYQAPGVFFAASSRLGELGGYIQLLEGVRGWFESDCTIDKNFSAAKYGEGTWYDPYYEGVFDVWKNCKSTDTRVFVLAARPKSDPYAYLILVEIHYITDADLEALTKILATFVVIGNF